MNKNNNNGLSIYLLELKERSSQLLNRLTSLRSKIDDMKHKISSLDAETTKMAYLNKESSRLEKEAIQKPANNSDDVLIPVPSIEPELKLKSADISKLLNKLLKLS